MQTKRRFKYPPVAAGILFLLVAPLVSGQFAIPQPAFLTAMVAIVMALWWGSEALPLEVTSLLPLIALPAYGVTTPGALLLASIEPGLLVFLGGFVAACAIDRHSVHRWVLDRIGFLFGRSARGLLAGIMLVTALASMVMSNTTAALIMMPAALAFASEGSDGTETQGLGATLALGVAYAATIGGMVTLIGTPPNILTAAFLKNALQVEIGFVEWMAISLPISATLLAASWAVLTVSGSLPKGDVPPAKASGHTARPSSRLSSPQRRALLLLALLLAGWLSRPLVNIFLPETLWNDVTISLLVAALFWLLPTERGARERLVPLASLASFPFTVLFLFGAGLMLAHGFQASGLTGWIGTSTGMLAALPGWAILLCFVLLVSLVTEFISNTASVAILLPIAAALGEGAGLSPVALALCTAFAANAAFIMPVATAPNTIAFMTGKLSASYMMRRGLLLNLIAVAIIAGLIPYIAP
ncbi:SLC13/DASS family transporter [Pacificimonas sp. WHA3]|uniref:SLC13/DASS family transporter n=1 Tax=Pacificimonas pallii TaxID=2827236 RepID=A0ABS6SG34_9SPHN|nr:SLC13 family permease [Pacificimonas pallii]MBV7257383.1 SLC13/DASS family transporter [Pacificimonas pallii]